MAPRLPLCSTCQQRVSAKGNPGLTCGGCDRSDHFTCLKIKLTDEKKEAIAAGTESYLCTKCKNKQRLSLSIVVATPPTKGKGNVKKPNSNESDKAGGSKQTEPETSVTVTDETLISTLVATIQTLNQTIKNLESKLQNAFDQIGKLQRQSNGDKKSQPKKDKAAPKTRSFTINGVPEGSSGDPKATVEKILKTADPSNELEPTVTVRKLTSKDKTRPSAILVTGISSSKNLSTLDQLKRRKIAGSDIGIEDCPKIFINESYPSQVYKLFKAAKVLRNHGYKFIWIKDNRVLARTTDNAPVIQIKSIEQLDSLVATSNNDNADQQ